MSLVSLQLGVNSLRPIYILHMCIHQSVVICACFDTHGIALQGSFPFMYMPQLNIVFEVLLQMTPCFVHAVKAFHSISITN
jgi:hypothetical protein